MIPAPFEYHRATSVDEAIQLLADNEGAKLLAGGHSLLPMMKLRLVTPTVVVDIGAIDELRSIGQNGDDLVVGATATHAEVASSSEVQASHAALAQAAAAIGDVQVRNCGTLGGSLAHADPAADYGAAVLAFDAEVSVRGPSGERTIPAGELFAGLLQTSLEPGELITSVRFPATSAKSAYVKFEQPASGFAIVGVAAAVATDNGTCTGAAIAATGVSDRPVRLSAVEEALTGGALGGDEIAAAAAQADAGLENVREDLYAGQDYRRHLMRVIAERAVSRATS